MSALDVTVSWRGIALSWQRGQPARPEAAVTQARQEAVTPGKKAARARPLGELTLEEALQAMARKIREKKKAPS